MREIRWGKGEERNIGKKKEKKDDKKGKRENIGKKREKAGKKG